MFNVEIMVVGLNNDDNIEASWQIFILWISLKIGIGGVNDFFLFSKRNAIKSSLEI